MPPSLLPHTAAAAPAALRVSTRWPLTRVVTCSSASWFVPIAAGTTLAIGLQAPLARNQPGLFAVNVATTCGFALATLVMARQGDQRRNAVLIAISGLCFVVGWIRLSMPGPLPYLLRNAVPPLFWAVTAWALLRYPAQELRARRERIFVVASFVWLSAGHIVTSLAYQPSFDPTRWDRDTWWPTLVHLDSTQYHRLHIGSVVVDAIVAATYLVIAGRALRARSGMDRWLLAPLASSIVAASVPLFVKVPSEILDVLSVKVDENIFQDGALLLVPIALVAVTVRTAMLNGVVAYLVTQLNVAEPDLQGLLRRALRDPELELCYRVPDGPSGDAVTGEAAGYLRPDGTQTTLRGVPDTREVVPLVARDGSELGALLVHPSLRQHGTLLDAVVSASTLALENGRLTATLRAQLEQLRASRRRIAEAGFEERRRLERDLHDGAQQRLLALAVTLSDLEAASVGTREIVTRARTELHAASRELRDLAHGIHPATLQQAGLGPAIEEVAARMPIPVDVDVPARRWPQPVESTAYFVTCEALTNVAKHARASQVEVRVSSDEIGLRLLISDDGRGGADPAFGTGLTGLRDRAHAVGGEILIRPGDTCGTVVEARLPCE